MNDVTIEQVSSEEELADIARAFISQLPADKDSATVVGLSGELGAGKTTFVQKVGNILGVDDPITSPTYVILKKYEARNPKFETLIHIDAYRLETADELEKLDWGEYLNNPENLICIEWPEHVAEALPEDMISISFEVTGDGERRITTDPA